MRYPDLRRLAACPSRLLAVLAALLLATDLLIACLWPHSSWTFGAVKHVTLRPHLADAYHYFAATDNQTHLYDLLVVPRVWPAAWAADPPAAASADNPFRRFMNPAFQPAAPLLLRRTSNSPDGLVDQVRRDGYRIDNNFYNILPPYDTVATDPADDVMLRALYCDRDGYDAHDRRILSLVRDRRGGYLDTHYLMALLFLQSNGCGHATDQDIREVTDTLLTAQRAATVVDDLYAERIVVLYWAGRGNDVHLSWIRALAAAQRHDGGWLASPTSKRSHSHTSGLAALALRYYLDGAPSQPILPR